MYGVSRYLDICYLSVVRQKLSKIAVYLLFEDQILKDYLYR